MSITVNTKLSILTVITLMLLTSMAHGQAREADAVGSAYDIKSKQLKYTSYHYYSEDGLDHQVIYKLPDNTLLAKKDVDYRTGVSTPALIQRHFLTHQTLMVEWQGKELRLSYIEQDPEAGGSEEKKKLRSKNIKPSYPLVIDAGFDHYIRERWQVLVDGKRIEFDYPVINRLSSVSLSVAAEPCKSIKIDLSEDHQCFEIKPSSTLLKLFLKPLRLAYDKQQKKLIQFNGLSNITDANDDNMNVTIDFTYPNTDINDQ